MTLSHTTAGKGDVALIGPGKTFLPLLAVQQLSHGVGYSMSVRQYASASEATAASLAARMRLRRGPIAIAAPTLSFRLDIPMEPEPFLVDGTVPLDMLRPCSWRFLVELAAVRHGQASKDIIGPFRTRAVVKARHEAVYLVVLHTQFSVARIGRFFNRDHTTLLSSLKKFPYIERGNRRGAPASRTKRGAPASFGKSKLDWISA
jgi:hypothetical protein